MSRLTPKQRLFVAHYLVHLNGTKAALEAERLRTALIGLLSALESENGDCLLCWESLDDHSHAHACGEAVAALAGTEEAGND